MANKDTVTIFFKAEGDADLINALKGLSQAEKGLVRDGFKLANSQKAVTNKLRALSVAAQKQKTTLAKLAGNHKLLKAAANGSGVAMRKLEARVKGYSKQALFGARNTRILGGSFAVLRSKLLIASFAFALVIEPLRRLTEAMREQVEAEAKLSAGLRNIGLTAEDASERLINYAAALQKVTTFGDEAIIGVAAMLTTFKLTEDTIGNLIPRVLDLSAATGSDLQSAAIQVGKAFTGLPSALTRSGVVIDKLGLEMAKAQGETEEFAFLVGELDKNFKGFAESLAQTDLGKLDQLKNQLGDLQEELGGVTLEPLILVTKALVGAIQGLNVVFTVLSGATVMTAINMQLMEDAMDAAESGFRRFGEGSTNVTNAIKRQEIEQANLIALLTLEHASLVDDGVLDAKEKQALVALKVTQANQLEKLGLISKEEAIKRTLKLDIESIKLQKTKLQLFAQGSKAAGDLSNSLVTLAKGNKQQTIAALRLAQAAAIGDAIAGSMKAFKQGGIAGFLAGTALLASGLARIQQINAQIGEANSVPVAEEGGFVRGKRHSQGGTMIEAEQGEFILSRDAVASIGLETVNRLNQGQQASSGITVNGDIYGFDDFRDKVLQANKVNGMGLA